jgi:hypothetical protein
MARQIAETPILFGEDATRFLHDMENIQPASEEEKAQSSDAYAWMKSIATFQM